MVNLKTFGQQLLSKASCYLTCVLLVKKTISSQSSVFKLPAIRHFLFQLMRTVECGGTPASARSLLGTTPVSETLIKGLSSGRRR